MSGAHEVFDTDLLNKLNGIDASARTVTGTTVPADVADAGGAAIGTDASAARADHVHAHGELAGAALHAEATRMEAGFLTAREKRSIAELEERVFQLEQDLSALRMQIGA